MELWLGQACGKDMKVWQLDQALASACHTCGCKLANDGQDRSACRSDLSIGRRRGSAAEQRYELAPPHSITSSARARSIDRTFATQSTKSRHSLSQSSSSSARTMRASGTP